MIKEELFDTQDKQDAAVGNFKALISTAGWQLVVKRIETNIAILEEMILTGIGAKGERLGLEETDRLRDNLAIYKEIRDWPEKMVMEFSNKEVVIPEPDPFLTREDLEKEKAQKT
jgi:hypothetical protein